MSAVTQIDFIRHLRMRLGFLRRSCESYDAGYTDEAIRVATVIRVLIHDSQASVSLLAHMRARNIELLSSSPELGSQFEDMSKYRSAAFRGIGMVSMSPGRPPRLEHGVGQGTMDSLPVEKWWNQIVWVLNPKTVLTRRSIVLTAANKDGGAHVDSALTTQYAALSRDGAAGVYTCKSGGQEFRGEIQNAHLVSLRAMAQELLQSPELLALANGS